jgi:hypothetical protein
MAATGILPQAALALPCVSRLLPRARIKHGAGFEDKQKSCAIMHKLFHSHSLTLKNALLRDLS